MTTNGAKLTPKQELLIAALLSSPTIQEAAHAAGVSEATAHRWIREAAFDAAYRAARRTAVRQAIARLQQAASQAVSLLITVINDDQAPTANRLRAAEKVIDQALKAIELEDLEARVVALEERYAEKH
jgi:DNA-binding MurR/RpiR family transcriptional regulator